MVDQRQSPFADVPGPESDAAAPVVFPASALDQLLDAIRRRGFRLVGPVVKDGAICYDDIGSAADLPAGRTDEQGPGR